MPTCQTSYYSIRDGAFLLGPRIEAARACGHSPEEKAQNEWNLRTQVPVLVVFHGSSVRAWFQDIWSRLRDESGRLTRRQRRHMHDQAAFWGFVDAERCRTAKLAPDFGMRSPDADHDLGHQHRRRQRGQRLRQQGVGRPHLRLLPPPVCASLRPCLPAVLPCHCVRVQTSHRVLATWSSVENSTGIG